MENLKVYNRSSLTTFNMKLYLLNTELKERSCMSGINLGIKRMSTSSLFSRRKQIK